MTVDQPRADHDGSFERLQAVHSRVLEELNANQLDSNCFTTRLGLHNEGVSLEKRVYIYSDDESALQDVDFKTVLFIGPPIPNLPCVERAFAVSAGFMDTCESESINWDAVPWSTLDAVFFTRAHPLWGSRVSGQVQRWISFLLRYSDVKVFVRSWEVVDSLDIPRARVCIHQ